MRERERLNDFRGGAVACRVCKRILQFGEGPLLPQVCCGMAYVPEQQQIDLVIYDRLLADEFGDIRPIEIVAPIVIPEDHGEEVEEKEIEVDDSELAGMVATDEQIAERSAERIKQLAGRGKR